MATLTIRNRKAITKEFDFNFVNHDLRPGNSYVGRGINNFVVTYTNASNISLKKGQVLGRISYITDVYIVVSEDVVLNGNGQFIVEVVNYVSLYRGSGISSNVSIGGLTKRITFEIAKNSNLNPAKNSDVIGRQVLCIIPNGGDGILDSYKVTNITINNKEYKISLYNGSDPSIPTKVNHSLESPNLSNPSNYQISFSKTSQRENVPYVLEVSQTIFGGDDSVEEYGDYYYEIFNGGAPFVSLSKVHLDHQAGIKVKIIPANNRHGYNVNNNNIPQYYHSIYRKIVDIDTEEIIRRDWVYSGHSELDKRRLCLEKSFTAEHNIVEYPMDFVQTGDNEYEYIVKVKR